nr:MAG TPA: hypothetical protein [Caudoviricetes sp.]
MSNKLSFVPGLSAHSDKRIRKFIYYGVFVVYLFYGNAVA